MTWRDELDDLKQEYRSDWSNDAACKDVNPDLFFPLQGERPTEAIAICRVCPVRIECLSWALEINQRYGVAGGRQEKERRKMRRALRLKD